MDDRLSPVLGYHAEMRRKIANWVAARGSLPWAMYDIGRDMEAYLSFFFREKKKLIFLGGSQRHSRPGVDK